MAKDAVARTTLDFLAGGNYSLCLTRFPLGCSVLADGDGHEACNDDTLACFSPQKISRELVKDVY